MRLNLKRRDNRGSQGPRPSVYGGAQSLNCRSSSDRIPHEETLRCATYQLVLGGHDTARSELPPRPSSAPCSEWLVCVRLCAVAGAWAFPTNPSCVSLRSHGSAERTNSLDHLHPHRVNAKRLRQRLRAGIQSGYSQDTVRIQSKSTLQDIINNSIRIQSGYIFNTVRIQSGYSFG